jgi:hypothetical protein
METLPCLGLFNSELRFLQWVQRPKAESPGLRVRTNMMMPIGVEEEAVDVRDYAAMAIEASSKVTNSFKDQT